MIHLIHLKSIELYMHGSKYYTFSHLPEKSGKKWRCFHDFIEAGTENGHISSKTPYHTNLTWTDPPKIIRLTYDEYP